MTAVDPWDVRRSPACEHTGTTHRSIVHAHYHHQRGYVPRQVQIICDDCGGCIATERAES